MYEHDQSLRVEADSGVGLRGGYVYSRLLARIRNGDIKPGERLTEGEVAKQLGVSRTPVREAFKALHARRLLNVVPGRGMELVRLGTKQVVDLYEMRATLEGMAASLAAERSSRPAIERMYAAVAAYEMNIEDSYRLLRYNMALHHEICQVSENEYLQSALSTLEDTLGLVRSGIVNTKERRLSIVDEHRAIVDAIARRDRAAAEFIARHHVKEAQRYRLHVSLED